jgi:predicted nucleic acid-binding protein
MVAALRSKKGASRQLLRAALDSQFELLLSVPLLPEYEAVLTRPAHLTVSGLSSAEVGKFMDNLALVAKQVRQASRWRTQLPDANDDMVLETPINGAATGVVTFNTRDFTNVCSKFGCAVLLPAAALIQLGSSS